MKIKLVMALVVALGGAYLASARPLPMPVAPAGYYMVACNHCHGEGYYMKPFHLKPSRCHKCNGTGYNAVVLPPPPPPRPVVVVPPAPHHHHHAAPAPVHKPGPVPGPKPAPAPGPKPGPKPAPHPHH